jgi:hypothetical protein
MSSLCRAEPNTEYVISVRAFNERGDGQPVYEQVRTRDRSAVEDPSAASPLFPPVGIKAIVHSETTVVVLWGDAGPPGGTYCTVEPTSPTFSFTAEKIWTMDARTVDLRCSPRVVTILNHYSLSNSEREINFGLLS